VPTALIAMTAIPITRQSTACPLDSAESAAGVGEGYHVEVVTVFWLALLVEMTLVYVPLPAEVGVGGLEVGGCVGVRYGCGETPVMAIVSCAARVVS